MSELMEELRRRLDDLGVEWTDRSEEFEYKSGRDWPVTYHMERTRFLGLDGHEASVIFGYTDCPDAIPKRLWMTNGAPYLLECWFKPYDRDPVALDIDMIIRVTLGK